MTVLYKPVRIESAEQAEALPEGAIATHDEHWPVVRCTPNRWESSARDMEHAELVGWTALVPIEAEEEWGEQAIAEGEFISVARLVTPWEEVANRP